MIRFLDPWWGLLAIPVLVLLVLSWRSVHGMAKGRKRLAFAIRALLALLVIAALTGPQALRPNRGIATVFVLDRSDSIKDVDRRRAEAFVRDAVARLGPDDSGSVVTFGERPVVEAAPGPRRELGQLTARVAPTGSDLASAVRLGSALFPDGKARRMVLLTDGNETRGDVAAAVEVAASQGVQVDVVALGTEGGTAEAWVVELEGPNERQANEPFELRAVIESTVAQEAVLTLDRDGQLLERNRVQLNAGRTTFAFDQKIDGAGFYRYRLTLEPSRDADNRNNTGASFTRVREASRVLVLQGDTSRRELVTALTQAGVSVRLGGAEAVPIRQEDFQAFDAIILNDFPATAMTRSQMTLMQSAVRDAGLGFAMVGGNQSFLPGGYFGSPVAEILPVDLNVRQRKTFPSTTVVIAVDCSGSMGAIQDGQRKIDLAAQAALETARLLAPQDKLGLVGSTDRIEFVAPIQDLRDRSKVESQIRRLDVGGGGIYAQGTMDVVRPALEKEQTKVRHFILLADGADVDNYGNTLDQIRRMKSQSITTSVVAIGDGKDVPFLQEVAKAGGGNFYLVTQASKLPAIFTQDVAMISRSAIEELTFVPRITGIDDAIRGLDARGFPALLAYNLADARPLARVSLKSPKEDPILATWQYGLGTSYAFMSDAQGRWARRWVSWDGFGAFWSQLTRAMVRRQTSNRYQMQISNEGSLGKVTVQATTPDGNPAEVPGSAIRLSAPDGTSRQVELTAVAPGRYEATFPADSLGSYIVTVAEPGSGGRSLVESAGFSVPYPPEYRAFRTNETLLNQVVEIGGGEKLSDPAAVRRPVPNPGRSVQDLWLLCLGLAAILLPLDIAVRRLALPWTQLWSLIPWRRRERVEVERPQYERLKKAKERVTPKAPSTRPTRPSAPTPPSTPPSTPAAPPAAPRSRSAARPGVTGQTSADLLAAKRKRQGQDES